MKGRSSIFNILAILLCLVLFCAQTPTARQVWLDWNHQFTWAVMVEVFYQWILPSTVVLFFLLFWQLRKEYQIQWPVFLSAIVIFPWIVSLWQQRQLVIDLPELSVALILVIIGLFFKIGRWLPVWAIVLLGVAFEFLELCFRQTRFFEWKDVGINLASILGGYCLISGSHAERRSQ